MSQPDYSEGSLILIILLIIALATIFNIASEYYVHAWYYIKFPLVKAAYYIPETVRPYLFFWIELIPALKVPDINYFINSLHDDFIQGSKYIAEQRDLGFFDVTHKSSVLNYMILPFIAIPLLILVNKTSSRKTFNKTMSMSEFRIQESERWPVIKPIIHLDSKVIDSINEGEWAMSMRPEVYFPKNDYLVFLDEDNNEVELKNKDNLEEYMEIYNFTINADKVSDFFLEQLGDTWEGVKELSIEEKHLLSVLLPKANRDDKKTTEMLNLFGNYYTSEKGRKIKKEKKRLEKVINKEMNTIFSKYLNTKHIQKTINKHHYKQTVFSALLEEARNDGVLSNGLFVWLKPLNRTLWFNMCSIGRKLPLPDAAGIWSHYLNEKAIGSAITLPRIQAAVDSVDTYFLDRYENYIPFNEVNKKEE